MEQTSKLNNSKNRVLLLFEVEANRKATAVNGVENLTSDES